jgi:hypothetical protein
MGYFVRFGPGPGSFMPSAQDLAIALAQAHPSTLVIENICRLLADRDAILEADKGALRFIENSLRDLPAHLSGTSLTYSRGIFDLCGSLTWESLGTAA